VVHVNVAASFSNKLCQCKYNFQLEDGLSEEFYLDDDDDDDEIKDPKSCWERVTDTLTSKPVLWGKQA
jgi:hypothetical protein